MAKSSVLLVSGRKFQVREHAGVLTADMNGANGWTFIWAKTMTDLYNRVRAVLTER